MKTQHLYFRYLSDMDLTIQILFSSDNLHYICYQKVILCIDWLFICIVQKYFFKNKLSDSL